MSTKNKHPINSIDYLNYVNKSNKDQFTYSKHLKDKFNLNMDMIKILDLLTIEEFLALKMEKTALLFNGKFLFPIGDLYKEYIKKAIYNISQVYETSNKKRKIRSLLLISRFNKLWIFNKYKKWIEDND